MNKLKLFFILITGLSIMSSCQNEDSQLPSSNKEEVEYGIQDAIVLKNYFGPSSNNASDQVFENFIMPTLHTGYYIFSGNNITIRNCKIQGGLLLNGDNVKIEHCEIIGGISLSGTATATISNNDIHSSKDDGIHITSDSGRVSDVLVAENHIHSFAPNCGAHADGIQVRGVDRLTILKNKIDMGVWRQACNLDVLNASIFLQNANGGNNNVTVDSNFLNGGGYVLYIGIGPNTKITNNRFGRDEKFGIVNNTSNSGDITLKLGNFRDDNGEIIAID